MCLFTVYKNFYRIRTGFSKISTIFFFSHFKLCHLHDEKFRESHWPNQFDLKRQNGMHILFNVDQMRALKLEGENSLHCSTSSSNSSLNQSPPQTPTAPALVAQHGPGRGGAPDAPKSRMNGMPPPFMGGGVPPPTAPAVPPPPLCESTPPPPFSNCTVPYSTYPSHVTLTAIPNRCIIQYSTAFRPSFNTPSFSYHPDSVFSSPSYLHVPIYSSVQQQQAPRNPPTCCNCGGLGHTGGDCTGQTIEDITQKAYTLEYSPLNDGDK